MSIVTRLNILCIVYCPPDGGNVTALFIDDPDDGGPDWFHRFWVLHKTVPLFLVFILFPVIMVRSPTFFAKFNSLGKPSIKACSILIKS